MCNEATVWPAAAYFFFFFFLLLLNLHIEFLRRKEGSLELGVIWPERFIFYDPQPQKTRSYAEKSTSRWIWLCQKDRIVTIQQLTLVLGRRARKGAVPLFFLTHRPHSTANFITSVPRQRWVPNRGKQTAAPLSSERDRTRAELLHRKSSQCTQISPQGHRVRAPCPNKRRKDCVCHRGGSRFYPHTILNALLVLAIW